jgi:hypothetical protein
MTAPTTTAASPVELELLVLDADACDPCQGAQASVEEAIAELSGILEEAGRHVQARLTQVTDHAQAEALGFFSSSTVRVDGVDIDLTVEEAPCASCSELVREPIACRTLSRAGQRHTQPPAQMIVDAVLRHLAGESAPQSASEATASGTSVARFLDARQRAADVETLRRRTRGDVLTPGDPGWDDARGTYNLVVDQRPALLALPEDAEDVVAVAEFARARGMQIVTQRTGHNAEPLGSLEGRILLRTNPMRHVTIDPERRRALVGGGAKWEDVVPQASELGFAALHGSTPDVSIAGYAMGGGVGWHGRKHGLATNSVTTIEIVTADGRLRWVDHDQEPELFWALRGGGGNFGVVTRCRPPRAAPWPPSPSARRTTASARWSPSTAPSATPRHAGLRGRRHPAHHARRHRPGPARPQRDRHGPPGAHRRRAVRRAPDPRRHRRAHQQAGAHPRRRAPLRQPTRPAARRPRRRDPPLGQRS